MRRAVSISLYLVLAVFAAMPAEAQGDANVADKENGRFTANLRSYADLDTVSHDMIDHIEMDIHWWGLLGQPVYIYGFKFVPTGHYKLPDGRRITREQFSEYPDLQSRFDDLRPSQVEVAFDIEITPRSTGGLLTGSTGQLATPNYYGSDQSYYANGATGTVTTSSFLTGRPNQMMQDLSPGSPREWRDFVSWRGATARSSDTSELENIRAQNTLREAQRIEFSNLRITKITPPDATAESILDEFIRREEKENTNEAIEAQEVDGNSTDPWADAAQADTASAKTAISNDPWSDALANDAPVQQSSAGDNPWGNTGPSISTAQADIWASSGSDDDFRIETRNQTMGVRSISGTTVIPFRDWKILQFSDGIAKVEQSESTSGSCNDEYGYIINVTRTGVVDQSGNWITPPTVNAKASLRNVGRIRIIATPEKYVFFRAGVLRTPTQRERAPRL